MQKHMEYQHENPLSTQHTAHSTQAHTVQMLLLKHVELRGAVVQNHEEHQFNSPVNATGSQLCMQASCVPMGSIFSGHLPNVSLLNRARI